MATIYPINEYPPQGYTPQGGGYPSQPQGYTPQGGGYPSQPPTSAYPPQAMPVAQPYYHLPTAGYPPYAYPVGQPANTPVQPIGTPQFIPQASTSYSGQPYPATPQYTQFQQNGYGAPYPSATFSNPNCVSVPQYAPQPGLAYPPGVAVPAGYQPVPQVAVPHNCQTKSGGNPSSQFAMREWRVGLCGCCEHCIPNFFMAWCCPCVSLAQIYARLGLTTYPVALIRFAILIISGAVVRFIPIGSTRRVGTYTSSSNREPHSGVAWFAFLVAQQIVLTAAIAIARRRVRQRFKIPGNRVMDTVTSCCCPCCTIAQIATQAQSYKPGSCDFTGPEVLPAFL